MDKMIESPEFGQTPADIVWKLRSAATLPKSMVAVAIALNAAADEIEQLRAKLDEADALIMDLTGMPWEAVYPTGSDKAAAIRSWQARCVERGRNQ